ncbi:MAG TPA: VCBS repeat-containing protein [Terriglobales bacterium]|nr:VCBS repeat-containing protein [Terriglobales bacterium]
MAAAICLSAPPRVSACSGDCDQDCSVDVAEIVVAIQVALGEQPTTRCAAADRDGSGTVAVDEILAALQVALSGCDHVLSFDAPLLHASGDGPRSLAIADLNGDGWPDVAAANHASHDLSVLLNDGTGTLLPHSLYAVGRVPLGVATADFDGNGAADIATSNGGTGNVTILLGNGDGSLRHHREFSAAAGARTILAADVDRNATVDLVIAAPGAAGVAILLGRGDGNFDRVVLGGNFRPWWIAWRDVTGDLLPDLVSANGDSKDVTVLAALSAGGFVPRSRLTLMHPPFSVAVADFERDSFADLVTGNGRDDNLALVYGRAGGFAAPVLLPAGDGPYPVEAIDIDSDALVDIVATNEQSGDISILLGHGDGSFASQQRFDLGRLPYALAIADLNRDGGLDLIGALGGSDQIVVRIRSSCAR